MTDEEGHGSLKAWLVRHGVLHVNHWWGVRVLGRYVYWCAGRLNVTKSYPHTEY